jgi:hypothetical protein
VRNIGFFFSFPLQSRYYFQILYSHYRIYIGLCIHANFHVACSLLCFYVCDPLFLDCTSSAQISHENITQCAIYETMAFWNHFNSISCVINLFNSAFTGWEYVTFNDRIING